MARGIQLGVTIVMMLVVITSAPALLCVGYFAQDSHVHDCCPSRSPEKVVPVCCVQSPAITTQHPNIQVFGTELSGMLAVEQSPVVFHEDSLPIVPAYLSPPISTAVLRI
jgi:hypothetical protein